MNGFRYGLSSQAVTVSRSTRVPRSGPVPRFGIGRERRIGPGECGDVDPAFKVTITLNRRPASAGEGVERTLTRTALHEVTCRGRRAGTGAGSRVIAAPRPTSTTARRSPLRGSHLSNSPSRRWQTRPRAAAATKKAPSGTWHGRGSHSTLEVKWLRSARYDTSRARYRSPIPPRRQIGRARHHGREVREV
jgi:hypothetical protein